MKKPVPTDRGYCCREILRWPYRLAPPFSPQRVGVWGEWLALRHLRRIGWDVLARNWRTPWGEIDLLAFDSGTLICVEVRTRLQEVGIIPEETIDLRKERQLESLTLAFMRRYGLQDHPYRMDVVAIETPDGKRYELRHSPL